MKHLIEKIAATLMLCVSLSAFAAEVTRDEVLMGVAQSHRSNLATINSRLVDVIYVGQFDQCASVAIEHSSHHYEHFRVCNGQIKSRNTVSPSWNDDKNSRSILGAVIQNAIYYGEAHQDDSNGYLISAITLGSAEPGCKNIEVVISYDGDLVDRQVQSTCSYPVYK